jgi:Ca2+-binding RTX toxin-like protein
MLQVLRKGSGTAEEAAASTNNILQKMGSEETTKRFKEMGVDLEGAFIVLYYGTRPIGLNLCLNPLIFGRDLSYRVTHLKLGVASGEDWGVQCQGDQGTRSEDQLTEATKMAVINGTPGNDNLVGFNTDDIIRGFQGLDTISGAGGQDLIYGNQDDDQLFGDPGDDTVYGGQNEDFISGGDDRDLIYGNFGDDFIFGNNEGDTIYGGLNNDTIFGGNNNDLIYGNLDEDVILGEPGNDTLYGGLASDVLDGGTGNDVVYGNFGNDFQVWGGTGGNDTLYGGQGNDTLFATGGGDNDRLFGNLGNDTFDFDFYNPVGSGNTEANTNRLMDFQTGVDKVLIDIVDAGDPEYTEVAAGGVTSVQEAINFADANLLTPFNDYVFIAGATNGYLIVNVDGDINFFEPNVDYVIVLEGANSLASFGLGDIISV